MAVLGRLLFASAERLDLPDLLSIDSFAAGDFKFLLKGLIGDSKPLVLRGFDVINPADAIGSQSLSIRVADSVVLYPGSLAGPFFHGLEEGNANAQPLIPELKKNATNFVYLTFSTFETARDTRAFWDPDLDGGNGGEFTQDINTESVLRADVNVSVSAFPDNTIPICKVVVGPSVIESIQDARDNMFRLGEGGVNPDPFSKYSFRNDPTSAFARKEPPTTMSSALDPNPFQGGDKNIASLKEWMDVVMTKLLELGGTTYWYEDTGSFGMVNLFLDSLGRSLKSKGQWEHSDATPGLLTWTEDIHFKYISDDRDIIIRSANKTLADEEAMYIELLRDAAINTGDVSVEWFNGVNFANGVTGSFENLEKGDWIKKKGDPNRNYRRIEEFFAANNLGGGVTSASLARSIRFSDIYEGGSETQRGVYTKGSYDSSEVFVVARSEADALNGNKFLDDIGGNMAWLAIRSDTIMAVSDITTTTLALIDITEADGTTAKVTSTAHGLVDGDRVTIADSVAGYNGTYVVDVVDNDNFFIDVADFGDELGVANAYYAIVTTTARSIPGGFNIESAQHGFEDNQTIAVAGTASAFDASYLIKQRSTTTFSIPVGSAIPNVTTGTATLARINVRSEFGMVEIKQGEAAGIGEGDTANVMSFVGMASIAETHPTYNLPPSYNTLNGQSSYNGQTDDNLTVRTAQLTAMMADKAQDKTIKLLLDNIDRVTNTQNVLAQEITFTALDGSAKTMHVVLPNSADNGSVTLAGTLSLNANQAAYFEVDRNAAFTVASLAALTVVNIEDVPLDENVFVFAVRLANQEVWLWDGELVEDSETRALSSHAKDIARQDRNLKLVRGGTWSWDLGTTTLVNNADAYLQIPGLAEVRNTVLAQSIVLANDGDVAYVNINRGAGAAANLTVTVAAIASVVLGVDTYIIARRIGSDVLVGEEGGSLSDGESQGLDASSSDQTLTYIGASNEADDTPSYLTNNIIADGDSLTLAIGKLDSAAGSAAISNNQDRVAKLMKGGTWAWATGGGTQDEQQQLNIGAVPVSGTIVLIHAGNSTAPLNFNDSAATIEAALQGLASLSAVTVTNDFTTGPVILDYVGADGAQDQPQIEIGANSLLDAGAAPVVVTPVTNINGSADLGSLTFSADAYLQIASLLDVRNTIPTSESPIVLEADGVVAYVDINRTAGGATNLTVNTAKIEDVTLGDFTVIIARRESNDVIVGTSSNRLKNGESLELYSQKSNFTNQDNNLKLIEGGTWSFNAAPTTPINVIDYTAGGSISGGAIWNSGSTTSTGSAFTLLAPATVIEIIAEIRKFSGTTGNVFMTIKDSTGSLPGTTIVTSNVVDALTIPGTNTDITFTFAPTLLAAGEYFWYITSTGGSLGIAANSYGNNPLVKKALSFDSGSTWGSPTNAFSAKIQVYAQNPSADFLTISSIAYIDVPGVTRESNTIQAQSIELPNTTSVAYVEINRETSGPSTLPVSVANIDTLPYTFNTVIIARRESNDVLVGTQSMRLILGESKSLDAGVSNQLLSVIPASNNADNSGTMRLLENPQAPKRIKISSVDKIVPDGTKYSAQIKNLLLNFDGAQIDFSTGEIFEADGTTPLGIDFTPATIAANQYRWYSVSLIPGIVDLDGRIKAKLVILEGTTNGTTPELAPRAPFAKGLPLGQVVVRESSGSIEDIAQEDLVQLIASGSGGSGIDQAALFQEDIKARLRRSFFEWVTPNIFTLHEDTRIDGPSTGTFNIANSEYDLESGQELLSTQHYGARFLEEQRDSRQVEVHALWNEVDTAATYEISQDGGDSFETVTMSRVGDSTKFRGVKVLAIPPGSIQNEYGVLNADSIAELNITTRQSYAVKLQEVLIGQKIKMISGELFLNKVGNPLGEVFARIVKDNSGSPGTEIVGENKFTINIENLSVGNIAVPYNISALLTAGEYWLVIETSAGYKTSFSTGVNALSIRTDSSTPSYIEGDSFQYDGSVWTAHTGVVATFELTGFTYDLRLKITASQTSSLVGYGLFYGESSPQQYQQEQHIQRFDVDGDLDITEFTITKFIPDAMKLRVYDVNTGQVYRFPSFAIDGRKIVFAAGQFLAPSETVILLFDQSEQGAFDNSDVNGNLLASNHLGSAQPEFDRSVAGRGIILRRPNGTLREISLDDFDNIIISSVP